MPSSSTSTVILALGAALLVGSREEPTPPSFGGHGAVKTTMQAMSRDIVRLDELLRRGTVTPAAREQVIETLTSLKLHAASLGQRGEPLEHPGFTHSADRLKRDIDAALADADRQPPNYYLAGSVAGSCLYCHGAPSVSPTPPP